MDCQDAPVEHEDILLRSISRPHEIPAGASFNPFQMLKLEAINSELKSFYIEELTQFDCYISDQIIAVFDKKNEFIGGVNQKWILINDKYQNLGIGRELLIQAFELGIKHPETMNTGHTLTKGGRANRRSAHKAAIKRAMDNGIAVPVPVLSDYECLNFTF